jgi:hypothetical protein
MVVLSLLFAPVARADGPDEALLAAQLASGRAALRLPALARAGDLDAVARSQAARMAAAGGHPFHNARLNAETRAWVSVGEVVGKVALAPGWDARLQQLFMASPTHRQVITNPGFTHVGIGTARTASGSIYAAEVFGRSSGGRPVPAPAPRASRAPHAPTRPPVAVAAPPPPPPPTMVPAAPSTKMATSTTLPGGVLVALPPLRAIRHDAGTPVDLEVLAAAALLAALSALCSVLRTRRSR